MNQPLCLYGHEFSSHLLLGTAAYPSLDVLQQAVAAGSSMAVILSARAPHCRTRTPELGEVKAASQASPAARERRLAPTARLVS